MIKILIIVFGGVLFCASQEMVDKNNSSTFLFSLNHSLQVPAGDLSKRYGNSSNISSSLMYKTKKDMFLSFEFDLILVLMLKKVTYLSQLMEIMVT